MNTLKTFQIFKKVNGNKTIIQPNLTIKEALGTLEYYRIVSPRNNYGIEPMSNIEMNKRNDFDKELAST